MRSALYAVLRGREHSDPHRLAPGVAALAFAVLVAGCGIGGSSAPLPTAPPSPLASLSGGLDVARGALEAALKDRGIGLTRPVDPYRPPESTALIDVPRAVFRAVLPTPTGGEIVVYELPDPSAAYTAARAQAAWLASGPGGVQFPIGTTHVIRVVGNAVVTLDRAPDADPKIDDVVAALESLGTGVPVAP